MSSNAGVYSCREVERLMHRFLDDEIDDLTHRRISQHLQACLECGLEFEVYSSILRALNARRAPVNTPTLARLCEFLRRLDHAENEVVEGPPGQSRGQQAPS